MEHRMSMGCVQATPIRPVWDGTTTTHQCNGTKTPILPQVGCVSPSLELLSSRPDSIIHDHDPMRKGCMQLIACSSICLAPPLCVTLSLSLCFPSNNISILLACPFIQTAIHPSTHLPPSWVQTWGRAEWVWNGNFLPSRFSYSCGQHFWSGQAHSFTFPLFLSPLFPCFRFQPYSKMLAVSTVQYSWSSWSVCPLNRHRNMIHHHHTEWILQC